MGKRTGVGCLWWVVVMVLLVMEMVVMTNGGLIKLCNMDEDELDKCRPSVTKPNPVDPPPEECCEVLKKADLTCLCSYKESPMLPALGIDPGLALGLPSKCHLDPPQNCLGSGP